MTHDELLAKIQSEYEENKHFRDEPKWKPFAALRAVVELAMNLQDEDPFHEDAGWNAGYNHALYQVIQAIEKELK